MGGEAYGWVLEFSDPSLEARTASMAQIQEGKNVVPALDLGALLQNVPRGAWVAISHDHKRVIVFDADISKVFDEAKAKGEEDPLVLRVPETSAALIL